MKKVIFILIFIGALITLSFAQDDWFKSWTGYDFYSDLKPGQWVKYKLADGSEVKYSVKEMLSDKAVIVADTIANGQATSEEIVIPLAAKPAEDVEEMAYQIIDENIMVGGSSFAAKKITATNQGVTASTWFAKEVPIYHYIKAESEGKVAMELLDYGPKQ